MICNFTYSCKKNILRRFFFYSFANIFSISEVTLKHRILGHNFEKSPLKNVWVIFLYLVKTLLIHLETKVRFHYFQFLVLDYLKFQNVNFLFSAWYFLLKCKKKFWQNASILLSTIYSSTFCGFIRANRIKLFEMKHF